MPKFLFIWQSTIMISRDDEIMYRISDLFGGFTLHSESSQRANPKSFTLCLQVEKDLPALKGFSSTCQFVIRFAMSAVYNLTFMQIIDCEVDCEATKATKLTVIAKQRNPCKGPQSKKKRVYNIIRIIYKIFSYVGGGMCVLHLPANHDRIVQSDIENVRRID